MVHGVRHSGILVTLVERKIDILITEKMKNSTSVSKVRAFRSIPTELR